MFDEEAYLDANPDVKLAVENGDVPSGYFHYQRHGAKENRPLRGRKFELLRHIKKDMAGIEIGPYFNPLVPKRDGYNCLTFDVFGTEQLRENARVDPNISSEQAKAIEPVDLIGSASDLEDIVNAQSYGKKFDYILASHNFEHLPDPIRFLQGAKQVLKPEGVLTLAIPDCRYTFDYFRWPTQISEWIEAYHSNRQRPTLSQIFNQISLHCDPNSDWKSPLNVHVEGDIVAAHNFWIENLGSTRYHDVHCSIFTPSSLQLLLLELNRLGFVSFFAEKPFSLNNEMIVHLRKTSNTPDSYQEQRKNLLINIREDLLAGFSKQN